MSVPLSMLNLARLLRMRGAMERTNSWTGARLLEHQRAQVEAVRRFAMERSPFYRRFHGGLEGKPLGELPVLTKTILMENFDELVTDRSVRLADVDAFLASNPGDALFRGRYVALATSGSTGMRGVFLFDPSEWLAAMASITRPTHWAGVRPKPFHPPRVAMIASTAPTHYSARMGAALASSWMPSLRIGADEPLLDTVERLNRWQPDLLGVYPSVLHQLAEEQIGGRLRIAPQYIHCSGEALTPEVRRRAQQAWNVKVCNTYGATEYAPIAADCPSGSMHLMEDGAFIEIADERGPVPVGVAGNRVLLTVFGRRTQPLIRYEISDMVRAVEGRCPCGRPTQLLDAIEGRQEDVLAFPASAGGTVSIHPIAFAGVLEAIPAAGWQVIQQDGALRVLLVAPRDPGLCDTVTHAIRGLLESHGAAPHAVEVREAAALERGATGKAPLIARRAQGAA